MKNLLWDIVVMFPVVGIYNSGYHKTTWLLIFLMALNRTFSQYADKLRKNMIDKCTECNQTKKGQLVNGKFYCDECIEKKLGGFHEV